VSASRWISVLAAIGLSLTAAMAHAQQVVKPSDNYDELYQRYLQEANMPPPVNAEVQAWGWLNALSLDRRARNLNDIVTIRVVESITGSGTADSALAKAGQGSAGVPKLFGVDTKLPSAIDPSSLLSTSSNTNFTGAGTTNRAGELTALMSARVSDVLPNGDLVVEGIREIEINGDRQIVVLTGVVRPYDVNPANVVLSTQIGQLRIRYFGQGLMKDNLKPGWLIRILNKVF
jgi:flagellar L-ring protein precursor FlgH